MTQGRGERAGWLFAISFTCGALSCMPGNIEVGDLPCPCADGFVCSPTEGRCVLPEQLAVGTECDSPEAEAWAFCDGFESPDLDAWMRRNEGGPRGEALVEYQTDNVYRGKGALRVRVSGGARAASVYAEVFSSTVAEVWVRGQFYIANVVDDVELIGMGDVDYQRTVVYTADDDKSDVHTHNLVPSDHYGWSPIIYPKDVWFCAVLHTSQVEAEIFRNELRIDRVDFPVPIDLGYARLDVGFVSWRHGPRETETREVLVDEVAVSTTELTCDGRY